MLFHSELSLEIDASACCGCLCQPSPYLMCVLLPLHTGSECWTLHLLVRFLPLQSLVAIDSGKLSNPPPVSQISITQSERPPYTGSVTSTALLRFGRMGHTQNGGLVEPAPPPQAGGCGAAVLEVAMWCIHCGSVRFSWSLFHCHFAAIVLLCCDFIPFVGGRGFGGVAVLFVTSPQFWKWT